MRKIKMLMILIMSVFFLPFMVRAEEANVSIDKITLDSKTDGVVVTTDASVDGLTLDFGLSFSEVGDKVVYKVDFVNKDSEDYQLNFPDATGEGYVTYQYAFTDQSNILKANSTKQLMITIEYKKEVPDNLLHDGKYTENNQVQLALLNGQGKSINPKTGQSFLFIILISAVLIGSSVVVFKKHKSMKNFMLLLSVGVLAIPFSIYALKQLIVTVNTKIEITKVKEFCVLNYAASGDVSGITNRSITDGSVIMKMVGNGGNMNTVSYFFKTNETFLQYMNRNSQFVSSTGDSLNPEFDFVTSNQEDPCDHNIVIFYTNDELEEMYSGGESAPSGEFQTGNSIIKDKSQGCYFVNKIVCGQH